MDSYNFKNKEEQVDALVEFINDLAELQREYVSEHEDSGKNYLEALFSGYDGKYKVEEFLNSGEDKYNEDIFEVVEHFKKKGLPKKNIIETILELLKPTACGIQRENNAVYQTQIGEIEYQLSGISGIVNGKEVNDVLDELKKGLTRSEFELVERETGYNGKVDYMYCNCDYDCWAFVVDPDELKKELAKKSIEHNNKLGEIENENLNAKVNKSFLHAVEDEEEDEEEEFEEDGEDEDFSDIEPFYDELGEFELVEALYTFLVLNHEGQGSEKYSMSSQLGEYFSPGPMWSESKVEKNNSFYPEIDEENYGKIFKFLMMKLQE